MKRQILFAVLCTATLTAGAENSNDTVPSLSLNPAVVTGTRVATDVRHLPFTVSVVDRATLTKNFRSSTLPTVTEQVPGLFVTSRGILGYGVSTGAAGGIKVRGIGSGAETLVLIDGQPQYAGLFGHPIADSYQTMLAERVEVLRGPASVLYGSNAMGGVMNIVTRQPATDGVNTNVQLEGGSYGTLQGQITNQVKEGRFSSSAGFSYGRTDGHRSNSEFEQYLGFVKLGYDLSDSWKARGDFNIDRFNASNPGEESNPYIDNDSKITRWLASLQLENHYDKWEGAVRLFYDWGHHNIDDGYHPGGTPTAQLYLHNDLMAGASIYESARLFEGNRITLGVDYQHFGGRAWNRSKTSTLRTKLIDKTENEVAGYIDVRQDIASLLTLDAGLRVDHHSQVGNELVPQGGATLRLGTDATVRASVSKGFRNPTIRELYMFRPANNKLDPERLVNYELAFSDNFLQGRLHFGLNLFYLKADNLITTEMRDGRPLNVNTGATENSGVEVETRFKALPNLAFNANYSYLHTSRPISGAPEHKLYVGGDFSKGNFDLSTGVQYIAGLRLASTSNAPKEYFTLWNLTASYRVLKPLRIYVRGENLLAQKYETMQGFPMPRATVMAGATLSF